MCLFHSHYKDDEGSGLGKVLIAGFVVTVIVLMVLLASQMLQLAQRNAELELKLATMPQAQITEER